MSKTDWLEKQVKKRMKYDEYWYQQIELGSVPEDPWKVIETERRMIRPKPNQLGCANTNSHRIPTLPLLPFYDKVYFFYSGLDWTKRDTLPPITSSSQFKEVYGLKPEEIISLAEEDEIIPVSWTSEHTYSEYMTDAFVYKLEYSGIPHLTSSDLGRLGTYFQLKNGIALPHQDSSNYNLVDHLISAAGVEAAWCYDRPITFDNNITTILERSIKSIGGSSSSIQADLFKANITPSFLLENLKLVYAREMSLSEYIKVFTKERRSLLHSLLKEVIQSGDPEDFLYEINLDMREIERTSKSRHWKILSSVGSIARSNAFTITGAVAGALSSSEQLAMLGAVLGKIADVKLEVPEEYRNEFNRFVSDKLIVRLSSLIQRKSPNLNHILQIRKEIQQL